MVYAAPYDTVGNEADVGLDSNASVLQTANSLKHELAMAGNLMFGPIVESISVDPSEKLLSVFSKFFSPKKIRFKNLVVFDRKGVSGMPFEIPTENESCRVLDWFNIRSGGAIELDVLHDLQSDFVNKITFFHSKRIKASKARGQKDMISESLIKLSDLNDISYSHSMARLKSLGMVSSALPESDKKINLQFTKREIFPVTRSIYIQEGPITYIEGPIQETHHERIFSQTNKFI